MTAQRADLTFKHNLKQGRHGWLRLTPAYSVKIVQDILHEINKPSLVLDPFSGTGTTGLVCGEYGINCDLIEINPFLTWLATAKTRSYSETDLDLARHISQEIFSLANRVNGNELWVPPINHIERWWTEERLEILARLFYGIQRGRGAVPTSDAALDLITIAFCRVAIEWSNAAFNHQSMSFKEDLPSLFADAECSIIADSFITNVQQLISTAGGPLTGRVNVFNGDSRDVASITPGLYDCVITSPPYPNRMSYIRELRPYMYWLGYLKEAREAGDLDWKAIGGTWGIATSRLFQWKPDETNIAYEGFESIIKAIACHSPLLANYVHKYFTDIAAHLKSLSYVLAPGAQVFYIVGNSKFFDITVPVEQIYSSLMSHYGFKDVNVQVLRKRNSKKELYEYLISAKWY